MGLFSSLPRDKSRVVRMHVYDGGVSLTDLRFTCKQCGYDDGWKQHDITIAEAKRGIPCPKCNEDVK